MPTILVCLLGALAVAVPAVVQEAPTDTRAALIAALERLMVTGEAKGDILRAWFRTGSVRFAEAGPVWKVDQPSFEGIDTSASGTALTMLSALPALLDAPREIPATTPQLV